MKTLTYPSGRVVAYTPDFAGHVVSAVDTGSGINYATAGTYNAPGSLTSLINGNTGSFAGITNTFSYNKRANTNVCGLDSNRKPDAQIVNAKGKTRKVFEAERYPNRKRNRQREAEYKKLKLPNETHRLK